MQNKTLQQNRQNEDKTDVLAGGLVERFLQPGRNGQGGGAKGDVRAVVQAVVRALLNRIQGDDSVLRVPGQGPGESSETQHRHLMPEVFVQLSGYTDFVCGREAFRLKPGEVCLMPLGTPHGERVGKLGGRDFCNLVIMYGRPRLLFHLAEAGPGGAPRGLTGGNLECPAFDRQVRYLEELVRVSREPSPVRQAAVKGLQLAYFSDVWATLEGPATSVESVKVARVRQLVSSRLASPELCVEWLAVMLRCHADYLSHLFRRETGMTLTRYINEQRVLQARDMLERSVLSVKEVAVAVGYGDPGYFARIFRRLTAASPVEYRAAGMAGSRQGGAWQFCGGSF